MLRQQTIGLSLGQLELLSSSGAIVLDGSMIISVSVVHLASTLRVMRRIHRQRAAVLRRALEAAQYKATAADMRAAAIEDSEQLALIKRQDNAVDFSMSLASNALIKLDEEASSAQHDDNRN